MKKSTVYIWSAAVTATAYVCYRIIRSNRGSKIKWRPRKDNNDCNSDMSLSVHTKWIDAHTHTHTKQKKGLQEKGKEEEDEKESNMIVCGLYVYPIKSCKGTSMESVSCSPRGFKYGMLHT